MRRVLSISCVVAAFLSWTGSAQASVFTTSQLDSGTACGLTIFSATAQLAQNMTCSGQNYSMNFWNRASETSLGAYSDIDRTGATDRRLIAHAYSDSHTWLTISGGSGTGSLQFQVDLTGHTGPGGCSLLDINVSCASLSVYGDPGTHFNLQSEGNATLTGTIPFTFDVAFEFRIFLEVTTVLPEGVSSTFRFTDFYSTAVLAPFVVLDSGGVALSGVSALSDAGYSYQIQTPSAIPEPASLLLLGIGLAGLAVVRGGLKPKALRKFAHQPLAGMQVHNFETRR